MCGIAGFAGECKDRNKIIDNMLSKIIHRGPDGQGIFCQDNEPVVLGHRRLSIIDLSANGAQPMVSSTKRFVISFNGEIYNAPAIKQSMELSGHHVNYRGTSDTEVLLEAFEYLGIDKTLEQIKGMFAIALYDREDKSLYLMRDRIGEKPLYYGFISESFVFASELPQLVAFPGFDKELDADSVAQFVRIGYITAPNSIYKNIKKLMPGHILTIKAPFSECDIRPYWDVVAVARDCEAHQFKGSFEDAVSKLDELMRASIKDMLVADVPLGAYLSAGIDSSAIVSIMTSLAANKVKTFTIGFEDEQYNEANYAREIARHLGTDHTELTVTENELKEVIPRLSGIYGEPFADSSQIPTYFVSKLAKSKVTVSLSGDAGDELFCGYRTYDKLLPVWNKASRIPLSLRSKVSAAGSLCHFGSNKINRMAHCLGSANIVRMKEELGATSILMDKICKKDFIVQNDKLLADDLASLMLDDMMHYHPDDILVKVDRAGMAVSLENRIPMLDKDIVEFAFSLPTSYKYDGKTSKRVLRKMLYNYVPESLLDRPKKGFSVPLTRWLLSGKTSEWAKELIGDSYAARDGILDRGVLTKLWQGFENGREPSRFVWNILMLEQWYRNIHCLEAR